MKNMATKEEEQIQQTIAMFEEAVRANPTDCQSLEILKEAYEKVGRRKESLQTMRQLADAYMQLAQYSSAMIEYAAILQEEPESSEIKELMRKAEEQMQETLKHGAPRNMGSVQSARVGGLVETPATSQPSFPSLSMPVLGDDGNDPLAKFLIQHKLATVDAVHSALAKVRRANKSRQISGEQEINDSLIGELVFSGVAELETLLGTIISRQKIAYIPLEHYDIDRQIVKMFPDQMTLGRLIVPFDLVSRTIMIATVNPLDASGKTAVQRMVDYHTQWYLCSPEALTKALRDAYRLEP